MSVFAGMTKALSRKIVEADNAHTYPTKPIRLIAIGPGGSQDFAGRFLAPELSKALGQEVKVEFVKSGYVPAETVMRSAPDGHTLLLSGRMLWLMSLMRDDAPYDLLRDFAPVVQTTGGAQILVVRPDFPAKTAADLIALAKAKPGELKYASSRAGGNNYLAPELFKAMAGVDIPGHEYENSAQRLQALLSGEVHMFFTGVCSFAEKIKAGVLKPIGVTSAQRSSVFPDVPTIAETGLPGYENITVGALFAPAKTPAAIVQRLTDVTVRIMKTLEAKEYFVRDGYEAVGATPAELVHLINADLARVGKLVKQLGIRGGDD